MRMRNGAAWVECIDVDMKTSKVGEMRTPTIPTCEVAESMQRKGVS